MEKTTSSFFEKLSNAFKRKKKDAVTIERGTGKDLTNLIDWCSLNCTGKWTVNTNIDAKGNPKSFTFYFNKTEDSIRFGLICK